MNKQSPTKKTQTHTEKLMKEFEKILSDKKIKQAVVIFLTDDETDPQVYRKGHFYDSAAMLNHVLRAYHAKVAIELGMQ